MAEAASSTTQAMRTMNVHSIAEVTPGTITNTNAKQGWLVTELTDRIAEEILKDLNKQLKKSTLITNIGGQIALVQSRDKEQLPKSYLMVFMQSELKKPFSIGPITKLKLGSFGSLDAMKPHPDMQWVPGEFEDRKEVLSDHVSMQVSSRKLTQQR
jgi:hypothetical protein